MKLKKVDVMTVIGIVGTALAFVGQLLSSHANDKKTDAAITEKVAEEVAKRLSDQK